MKTKTRVECCYADKCNDVKSSRCVSCINNEKRSYYQPQNEPDCFYWPYYREPYYLSV